MGVNNRKRRAAKQRKRARERGGRSRPQGPQNPFQDPGWDAVGAYGFVELKVAGVLHTLSRRKVTDAELVAIAESLRRRIQPHPSELLEAVTGDMLARITTHVLDGGWGPGDLRELVRRNAGPTYLPVLAALLDDGRLRLNTVQGLAAGLRLAALLSQAPSLEASDLLGVGSDEVAEEHPKLARVRALLAKAESTDYDEEAEALSAKAQELITKYALDRLVDQGGSGRGGTDLQVRRLWLDPPYVGAKASLVHVVAGANRCRAASADHLGFCVLVGAPADLHFVELLVTSLLVQADAAMLRHGRRYDESGVPRTRSFRRSFLMAYGVRIGERLREAEAEAVRAKDDDRLLPVLRDHRTLVDEAFDAVVPHTEAKAPSISNGEGWYAGLAAADLALLDVSGKLPSERAG